MPSLEVILITEIIRRAPELIAAARKGDTDAALTARTKRLAIDTAFEVQRRLRAARGNQ